MSRAAFREHIVKEFPSLPPPASRAGSMNLPPKAPDGPPLPPATPQPTTSTLTLPEFMAASNIVPANIVLPELLIDSLLHRGCKIMVAGGSKSFKSWVLLDMGISVAMGLPWWGLGTKPGAVIYLNFELIAGFLENRIVSVCRAKQCELPQNFLYWNLRGFCYDLDVLAKVLTARLATMGPIALIIVDPIYKALGDLDENSASDMTKLMNLIEKITTQTGAAVAFGSHFSKGNQSSKEAKDRPSGSGVLIRDPDAILTMTRHAEDNCYVVNSELRYLPALPEFVVRWNFPIMTQDESLDPRQLYQPGRGEGVPDQKGPQAFSENDILDCLPYGGAVDNLWRRMVALKFNRTGPEYYACKDALLKSGQVKKEGQKYVRTTLKFEPQTT